eukprot:841967-Pelagomonas_calceolata.AAC.3
MGGCAPASAVKAMDDHDGRTCTALTFELPGHKTQAPYAPQAPHSPLSSQAESPISHTLKGPGSSSMDSKPKFSHMKGAK